MSRSAWSRRLADIQAHRPEGCPACRTSPPLAILLGDEPEPPGSCEQCGRVFPGIRVVRIRRVERGPM